MSLVLFQKDTIGSGAPKRRFDRRLLKLLSRSCKALRLRRKDPQWIRIALLVLAVDIVLAAVVWIILRQVFSSV
jgi:hypothetical protein